MEHTLRLGEWTVVGRGWLRTKKLMFAGESSPGIYTLVQEWTKSHNSSACNLFFSKDHREFQAFKGRIIIHDVNKKEIRFRFEK